MSPSLSVVIPTYNRVEPLERALDSVFVQTVPPTQVIVVDDGSDDSTKEMLRTRFSGVCVESQPHRGVSAARNRGIAAATGEWVAFLDSDDAWLPQKLELQLAALEEQSSARLCHCDEIWIRDGVRVNPGRRHRKSGGRIFRQCLELCLISPSAAILHRSVFEDVGLFDESLPACEDYDFWLRFTASREVVFVDHPLVLKHGGHADQLSRTTEALDKYRIRALVNLLDGNCLEPGDRRRAVEVLLRKLELYRAGVIKRGRDLEARELQAIGARFSRQARDAVVS